MEINSHCLLSKWMSESGKLVMKLFDQISEIAEDDECFVCVLIDEVESIASSRSAAGRSNEPGDAVRVVNAVLTSLDSLKRKPNVLVLCTSNLVSGIDEAFRDRVDYNVYIGPPALSARYEILKSCIMELLRKGIIQNQDSGVEEIKEGCVRTKDISNNENLHFTLQKIATLTEVKRTER
jgi:pachytene checkpoint protein 2